MAFSEETKPSGRGPGRPKTGRKKNKLRLIRYHPKNWDTSCKHNSFNIDEVTFRLENNLPLDDLFDKLHNKYERKPKNDD